MMEVLIIPKDLPKKYYRQFLNRWNNRLDFDWEETGQFTGDLGPRSPWSSVVQCGQTKKENSYSQITVPISI